MLFPNHVETSGLFRIFSIPLPIDLYPAFQDRSGGPWGILFHPFVQDLLGWTMERWLWCKGVTNRRSRANELRRAESLFLVPGIGLHSPQKLFGFHFTDLDTTDEFFFILGNRARPHLNGDELQPA